MKRLEAKTPQDIEKEQWLWQVDRQGRVMHRDGKYLHHAAKTLYIRQMGLWQKLGYWCDSCHVGLLLERSTEDVDSSLSIGAGSRQS